MRSGTGSGWCRGGMRKKQRARGHEWHRKTVCLKQVDRSDFEVFRTLLEAKAPIKTLRKGYNQDKLHSSLENRAPNPRAM